MANYENVKADDKTYIANTYGRFDLELVKGQGSLLYDETGKEYIDLGTGIAVNAFGNCDETWKQAVIDQLNSISHTSNLYYSIPQVKLAKLMCEKTGMKKVFFGNSGAEANECAIKVARKYSSDKYGDDRNIIITLVNSFHGRTITTLSATGQDVFHKSFGPFTPGFVYAHANDFEEVKALCKTNKVCGIMMELCQGEGGVFVLDKQFVKNVETLCKENDYCLIIDEVQTGNGRTGKLYDFMNYDIQPDVVSTAKGIAGGLPFGACMISEKCENVLSPSSHGSTFGGNPVCAAGAYSIMSRIDDELLAGVMERSAYIIDRISGKKQSDYTLGYYESSVPGIESISGFGLMLGIKSVASNKDIINECIKRGVICLSAKDKVRLLPALNIPMEQLEKAIDVLLEVISEIK